MHSALTIKVIEVDGHYKALVLDLTKMVGERLLAIYESDDCGEVELLAHAYIRDHIGRHLWH